MIYAISDLHGCYKEFLEMLEQIHFCEEDTLYVLGDIVDRGMEGIKLLLDLAERKNVICLRGNHDQTALQMLKYLKVSMTAQQKERIKEVYELWFSDGGYPTFKAFIALEEEKKKKVLSFLNSFPIFEEITVGNRNFFLSHTGPEFEKIQKFDLCQVNDFLIGEIEYEKIYFDNKYFVSGHTPTNLIDETYQGRIYTKNKHIAIDCGVFFGDTLGCICLDTMEEFYVRGGLNSSSEGRV